MNDMNDRMASLTLLPFLVLHGTGSKYHGHCITPLMLYKMFDVFPIPSMAIETFLHRVIIQSIYKYH